MLILHSCRIFCVYVRLLALDMKSGKIVLGSMVINTDGCLGRESNEFMFESPLY